MAEAIDLAQHPGAPRGENPRVGCVIVTPTMMSWVVGGTAAREPTTLKLWRLVTRDRGPAEVPRLSPRTVSPHRTHTPCTGALIDAGVVRVVFAQVIRHRRPERRCRCPAGGGGGCDLRVLEHQARRSIANGPSRSSAATPMSRRNVP